MVQLLGTGSILTAIVSLLVWLNKDGERKIDVLLERSDANQKQLVTHYEARIAQIVERSEQRVSEVTDKFIAELQGNREAAIARRKEDQQMHEGYQRVISDLAQEVRDLTKEVRQIASGKTQACRHEQR